MSTSSRLSSSSLNRVLVIAPQPFFEWRGTPIRVGFDVRALAEAGMDVDLLTLPVGRDVDIPGVRVLRVSNPLRVKRVPIGPSAQKLYFDVMLLLHGIVRVFRRRYGVIHGIEDGGMIALGLGRLSGARVIYEKHSDPASYRRGALRNLLMAAYATIERACARHADAVVCTGPGIAESVRATGTTAGVHVIPDIPSSLQPAHPDRVARLRRELCPEPGRRVVLFVGSFTVYQGVDLLAKAAIRLQQQRVDTCVVIIGGLPSEIAGMQRSLAAEGSGRHRVRFLGQVSPDVLPDYLAAADVLVCPRLQGHNTPMKVLDYLKAGRAIVATNTEANRLILDEATAVLTESNPESLADGIARVLDDPALAARLIAAGQSLLAANHTYDEFKRRLACCYAGLSHAGCAPAPAEATGRGVMESAKVN